MIIAGVIALGAFVATAAFAVLEGLAEEMDGVIVRILGPDK